MKFTKYHGLGNHFIFISKEEQNLRDQKFFDFGDGFSQVIQKLCDPFRGVGADGVIMIHKYPMISLWNADGSSAKTCGNALRCLALWSQQKGLWDGKTIQSIQRIDQEVIASLLPKDQSDKNVFTVDMGKVKNKKTQNLPQCLKIRFPNTKELWVSLENEHWVFGNTLFADLSSSEIEELGLEIQKESQNFSQNVPNVGFISQKDHLHLDVVERGVGLTECCGSGACAAYIAWKEWNPQEKNLPRTIKLKGGDLHIQTHEERLIMKGEAEYIYSGKIDLI
jgi:diaminopimelate epimerase